MPRPNPREAAPELGDARRALRELVALRSALDGLERALVDRARLDGVSWEAIGGDLGIAKQNAHRRHARHDPLAGKPQPWRRTRPFDPLIDGPTAADAAVAARVAREMGLTEGDRSAVVDAPSSPPPEELSDTTSRARDEAAGRGSLASGACPPCPPAP